MRNPLLLPRLVRFLRNGNYDVIHSHNTACQFMVAATASMVKANLVTTEHNTNNRRRKWKVFKVFDRWMYNQYDKIVCVGDDVCRSLTSYLTETSGGTVVISNGIDMKRISCAKPAEDIAADHKHKILMVAAFRAQKDHSTLINAMSLLPDDYSLYLAGGAETLQDRRVETECKKITIQKGLGSRVHFLGIRNDIPSVMAACDVVILSSHYEGESIVSLEGMASGKPFIASDVDGLGSLVKGSGLLFKDGDSKMLADLIRMVAEDTEVAEKVTARCKEMVKRYDISRTVESYSNVYESIKHNSQIK